MKIISIEKENSTATTNDYREFGWAEILATYELHQTDFIRNLYFKDVEDAAILALEATTHLVEVFLLKYKDTAPRTIYQYACEKMGKEEKQKFKMHI